MQIYLIAALLEETLNISPTNIHQRSPSSVTWSWFDDSDEMLSRLLVQSNELINSVSPLLQELERAMDRTEQCTHRF